MSGAQDGGGAEVELQKNESGSAKMSSSHASNWDTVAAQLGCIVDSLWRFVTHVATSPPPTVIVPVVPGHVIVRFGNCATS